MECLSKSHQTSLKRKIYFPQLKLQSVIYCLNIYSIFRDIYDGQLRIFVNFNQFMLIVSDTFSTHVADGTVICQSMVLTRLPVCPRSQAMRLPVHVLTALYVACNFMKKPTTLPASLQFNVGFDASLKKMYSILASVAFLHFFLWLGIEVSNFSHNRPEGGGYATQTETPYPVYWVPEMMVETLSRKIYFSFCPDLRPNRYLFTRSHFEIILTDRRNPSVFNSSWGCSKFACILKCCVVSSHIRQRD